MSWPEIEKKERHLMAEEKIVPMREGFPRWYRPVDMGANRDRLEARWKGLVGLVQSADARSVGTMIAVALRTKPRPDPADIASLRGHFKAADDLFDMEGNDRELEILSGAALATLFGNDGDVAARAALATTTASCLGLRTADFPLDLAAAAEAAIARISEDRRKRPDLSQSIIQTMTQVGADQESVDNLKQNFNADTVTALFRQARSDTNELAVSINSAVRSMSTFTAIQDEELQMLWWLFGGRSKRMDCPFADVPADAQPIVLAAEVADATEFLPGPASAKPILSRAGLKERKRCSIPAAVNACDLGLLRTLVDGMPPSPVTQPLHFAIKRRLETGDETSWMAGWSTITGIDSAFALPGIELGNLFYRERLGVLFGE
jgi:hypothetical protein